MSQSQVAQRVVVTEPSGMRVRPAVEQRGVAEINAECAVAPRCPRTRLLRDRLRAMATDQVSAWRAQGVPAAVRNAAGLRGVAESLVKRAGADPADVGWTMVTIVSEFWRERISRIAPGRRLLLLPDCPVCRTGGEPSSVANARRAEGGPQVCGPACGIATIWSAARESGWVVEPVGRALAGIGGLLTGQFDGALGIARLRDLEKGFAMLPTFSMPVAAVPFEPLPDNATPPGCSAALSACSIDVDWVLGLLGVAGGDPAPVGDYLPLLREAADMFTPRRLAELTGRLQLDPRLGGLLGPLDLPPPPRSEAGSAAGRLAPLDATAVVAAEYLTRGGKFLRPFICLAAFDAVRADRGGARDPAGDGARDAARAAAVAIEIFHKASLVHDDIEDSDAMRYGRPTLHVEHGIPSAINVGDYLLGAGYRVVSALPGVGGDTTRDLVAILADAHVRLARGQGAELWWRECGEKCLTPAEALEIYGLKTSPAFEAAVAMGIRLAGVKPEEAGAIARYSLHVGTGFQVLNDLKDWSGDLENDRRAAGDLLGGRPTVMWALALERATDSDAALLRRLARQAGGGEAESSAAVAAARRIYAAAGVFDRVAAIVAEQRAAAAAAAATCRLGRLREVLEFLLDLAVPDQASGRFSA